MNIFDYNQLIILFINTNKITSSISELNHHRMKQLISMPSTKPEQFLYTDFSVVSAIDHPKHSLTRILSYIKNVLKMRIYLCFRDIEQLYQNQQTFFNKYLSVYSCDELWSKLNKNNGETLQERQIVSIFTKIVITMTKQKNQAAQDKRYQQFAQLKSTVQWLQQKILQTQTLVRDRIKQQTVRKRTEQQNKRQKLFAEQSGQIKQELQINLYRYQKQLNKRHRKQKKVMKKIVDEQVQKQGYLYKPSKYLSLAKDESLLGKLAPFKNQKKRPFQCKSLQNKLSQTIERAKQRTERQIEQHKYFQSQKVKRRQQIQHQSYISRLSNKNSQTLARIQQKKTELNKSQNIKMYKLLSMNNKITNQRVSSLQKSLNRYTMHDESKQIKNIMRSHRQAIQFINNAEQIGDTSIHSNTVGFSPKYGTIDAESDWTKKKKLVRYSQQRIQNKILRKLKNQTLLDKYGTEVETELRPARKSLVDLYDEDLNHV